MGGTHLFLVFLYRLSGFALFGLLAIVLVGPVVAVVGVLASFAFIGFLFWLPARLLLVRKPVDWGRAWEGGRMMGNMMGATCGRLGQFMPGADAILEKSRRATLFLTSIFREATCGALVGAMLGSIRATQGQLDIRPILLGLFLGAGVGGLVAMMAGAVRLPHLPSMFFSAWIGRAWPWAGGSMPKSRMVEIARASSHVNRGVTEFAKIRALPPNSGEFGYEPIHR